MLTGPLIRPGFWLALALIGQAVSLQMINAGPLLHYQHYWPLGRLAAEQPLPVAWVALQGLAVALGLRGRWGAIRSTLRQVFRWWQLVGVALIFVLAAAAVQRDAGLYLGDLVLSAAIQGINLATIVLLVWSLPPAHLARFGRCMDDMLGRQAGSGGSALHVDRFVALAALWVITATALLSVFIYQAHPHITDEVAYLYQARFFAQGVLTLPAPPVPQAFDFYLMETLGDRWFLPTPPGWPAVLAIGVRLGAPWLVNPLLSGLNIVLVYLLLGELYDRRLARASVLLLCASPWFIFMGMNLMTHTLTLTCALAAAVAVARARRRRPVLWAALAGAAIGLGSLIRPLDGAIVGAVVGLWALGVGGRRLALPALAAMALATAVTGGLVLPYNQALTGSPTVFPLNAYVDEHFGAGKNDMGFGPDRGFGWALQPFAGHSPLGALVNANLNTFSINVELFGWSIGSLLLVAIACLSGALKRTDYLMLGVCLAVFVPYFFYYFSGGPDFGARYWYLMLVPLVALTIQGARWLAGRVQVVDGLAAARIGLAVAVLCLLALTNYMPWRALDKYYHFWGMRPDCPTLAQQYGFGRSLVLIRGRESHPDYASAAIYNPLDWDAAAPIYAWDRDQDTTARLLKAFADRPVWMVNGPSLTGAGYEVAAGPLSPQELLNAAQVR